MGVLKFKGIPSGDYESFVFAVDKETFKAITGSNPTKYDKSPFEKGMYMVYPNTLFPKETDGNGKTKEVTVTIEI